MTEPISNPAAIRASALGSARLLTAPDLAVSNAMARLEREGVLQRIIPGVYLGARHPRHPLIEVAAWTLRHPNVVVCLLTAAVFHDLTDAFARGTWLFVPVGASVPRSSVVKVNVVQTAPRFIDPAVDGELGIVKLDVHGVEVRVTDPDRTTLDLWRYPRRVASENAVDALRRRVSTPGFDTPRFARLARKLEVWDRVEPILRGLMLR